MLGGGGGVASPWWADAATAGVHTNINRAAAQRHGPASSAHGLETACHSRPTNSARSGLTATAELVQWRPVYCCCYCRCWPPPC